MNTAPEPQFRPRDPLREGWERTRYRILERVYQEAGEDCGRVVHGHTVAEELGLSPGDAFRAVEHLTHRGFLRYLGAGPRVCITEKGVQYLQTHAWRRRSVRDE